METRAEIFPILMDFFRDKGPPATILPDKRKLYKAANSAGDVFSAFFAPQKTGLSAPIFCFAKGFPLLSLAPKGHAEAC
jgi:hypothetical protein